MHHNQEYQLVQTRAAKPNRWDIIAVMLLLSLLALLVWSAQKMASPYAIGDTLSISLDAASLPGYALRTTVRMGIALAFSLIASFTLGALSAHRPIAEKIILPLVDILQSVPILGFLSITIASFIQLFPGSLLGPECAAIFAIFTSQAWNMILSVYQSLKTVPAALLEAGRMYQLNQRQRFWRIEIPFAMPALIWNMMISLSGGWFFVVACEAIDVANQQIMLPGIGSYIAMAIQAQDITAINQAILTMFIVILLYDQLVFRPLLVWSRKFIVGEQSAHPINRSWLLEILQRAYLWQHLLSFGKRLADLWINFPLILPVRVESVQAKSNKPVASVALTGIIGAALFGFLGNKLHNYITVNEIIWVAGLGLVTAVRVLLMITVCSIVWIPIGVMIGLRPKLSHVVQPVAQFLAAFPANLLFPFVVSFIVYYQLNVEIWTTPLIILGTQWYILFNVIAGCQSIPEELSLAAKNFQVSGRLWWRKVALPAIFPYFTTGALAAAGGAWNASILAETVRWGDTTLVATGLGAYITQQTSSGDFPRIALGIGMMCLYVYCLNRLLWQPLYNFAQTRFRAG